jgi:hypothetical protein
VSYSKKQRATRNFLAGSVATGSRKTKSPGQTGPRQSFSRQRSFRARAIALACHASVKLTFSNEKSGNGHHLAICKRLRGMTADECRQRAEEATRLAAENNDLWEREILFKIASEWQLLAVRRATKRQTTVLKVVPGKPRSD